MDQGKPRNPTRLYEEPETSRRKARLSVTVASDLATIEDAQRLRYKVFAEELGAELRSGGEPAWDTEFGTADFLMLIGLDRVNGRYARHFALVADDRP